MNQQTPEHMNMDAAQGKMPPPAVPNRLKKKLPKGELNPYTKTIKPHKESVRENTKREPKDGKKLEEQQLKGDFIRATSLLGSGPEKESLISQKALEETTKVSEEELQKRDKQIFQTWIQQNPVPAARLGIDPNDPFEEKKGKSPLKYYKDSPLKQIYGAAPNPGVQHMSRAQAFNYGKALQDPMANAGVAGAKLIQEKMAQWDQERAAAQEKLKKQKDREAKEILEASKPLVQAMDNSAALDESTKQLMAQQWKQGFVENEKKYKNGEIDQYEYGLNKAQALNNAQQYAGAVDQLTQASKTYSDLLDSDSISDAMTPEARDFYTSIAAGKGFNIQKSSDGSKTSTAPGLSIQNDANGNPTLMGYTAGQEESARNLYNTLTQEPDPLTGQPKLNATETSFEAWVASLPRTGDPKQQEFLQMQQQQNQQRQAQGLEPLDYESWINGVNIPIANLVSGEGLPEMVEKDKALDQNITAYADDIAQKAINNATVSGPQSTDKLWQQAQDYALDYTNQVLDQMGEKQIKALAADVGDMTPEEIRKVMDTEGGLDALKKDLGPHLVGAIKNRFEHNPDLAILNKEYRARQNAMAKQANAAGLRGTSRGRQLDEELQRQRAQALSEGNYQMFVGQGSTGNKIDSIEPIEGRTWGGFFRGEPKKPMFKVSINGEKLEEPITEDQLKTLIADKYGIKGSHMNQEGTGQPQAPQLNEAQSSEVDDIMAELGFQGGSGSPIQKRSPLKAYPVLDHRSKNALIQALMDKEGLTEDQAKWRVNQRVSQKGGGWAYKKNSYRPNDAATLQPYGTYDKDIEDSYLDSTDFGISDEEHSAGNKAYTDRMRETIFKDSPEYMKPDHRPLLGAENSEKYAEAGGMYDYNPGISQKDQVEYAEKRKAQREGRSFETEREKEARLAMEKEEARKRAQQQAREKYMSQPMYATKQAWKDFKSEASTGIGPNAAKKADKFGKQFLKDWYSHPETKRRLQEHQGIGSSQADRMISHGNEAPAQVYDEGHTSHATYGGRHGHGITFDPTIKGAESLPHERVHASGFDKAVGGQALKILGRPNSGDPNWDKYLSNPREVYGKLTDIRLKLGVNPGDKVTKEMIEKKWSKMDPEEKGTINSFDLNKLIETLNTVASLDNTTIENNLPFEIGNNRDNSMYT